jgi:hypothetical protein
VNERVDGAAENALEEDITDAKKSRKKWAQGVFSHHEIQIGNYRVEGRLNQPKQKGASSGIQTKDGVYTRNT